MSKRGLLIVVSGPSGTGKGTVCKALMTQRGGISYSISATTRQPREGEVDGINYYFISTQVFQRMIRRDEFLEWAAVYGNYYGTPLKKVMERLAAGQDVLLEIDTQGAINVMKKFPEGVFIYILPPSLAELEQRIRGRGTESEESLQRRLSAAKAEIEVGRHYKYVIVNDEVESAAAKIGDIISAEHCRVEENMDLINALERENAEGK